MTLGISNVKTSYFIENGGCVAKITGEWETDCTDTHVICGCYMTESNYMCFEWGNSFYATDGESGTFELYGMDMSNYVEGYDFYYIPGEDVDISLLSDPFDPSISLPIGRQHAMAWETCVDDVDETLEMLMYTAVGVVGIAAAIIIGKELI